MSREEGSVLSRYVILSSANFAAAAIGFAVVLLIARRFGAAGLGDVSLAVSLTGYAVLIAALGTDILAVKETAVRRVADGRLLSSVVALRLIGGVVTYALLMTAVAVVPRLQDIAVLVALFGLTLFPSAVNVIWLAQAKHRTDVIAVGNVATQALYFSLAVVLVASELGLEGLAVAKVAAELVVAAAVLWWAARRFGPLGPPLVRARLAEFARDAAPIGGTQLLRGLTVGSDILILGFMVGSVELGYYSAASRVFMLLLTAAGAYFVILLPRIAERAADPAEVLRQEVHGSLKQTLPIGFVAIATVALAAGPALARVFGPPFIAAAMSLRLLAASVLPNVFGRHYRQVLLATGGQAIDFRVTVVGAAVHLVAKIALIPALGITGAALGTLIGETLMAVLLWRAARPALYQPDAPAAGGPR